MHRRDVLKCGLAALAVPAFGATGYSVRAIDLVAGTNVVDMLSLPTLDWALLDKWHTEPCEVWRGGVREAAEFGDRRVSSGSGVRYSAAV